MKDMGNLTQFLGINIRRTEDGIYLNQKNYLSNLLQRFGMDDCKESKTPMEAKVKMNKIENIEDSFEIENKPIRELIGCLMYVMLGTRPDLSASVNFCSRLQSKPSNQLWKMLKRILRYIKGTLDYELFFVKIMKTS